MISSGAREQVECSTSFVFESCCTPPGCQKVRYMYHCFATIIYVSLTNVSVARVFRSSTSCDLQPCSLWEGWDASVAVILLVRVLTNSVIHLP